MTASRFVRIYDPSVQTVVDRFVNRFSLSKREAEATVFLAHGLRVKKIAQHMSCSEKNVYAHLARVCKKTGCRDHNEVICTLLVFACHGLGHSSSEHVAVTSPFALENLDHSAGPKAPAPNGGPEAPEAQVAPVGARYKRQ